MTFSIAELDRSIGAVSAPGVEQVARLDRRDLLATRDAAVRLKRIADVLLATVAGEVARRSGADSPGGNLARQEGFTSPTRMMADALGGTLAEAGSFVEVGAGMRQLAPTTPDAPPAPRFAVLTEATRAGEISVQCSAMLVRTLERLADQMPACDAAALERRLVAKACGLAVHDLRQLLWRVEAQHSPQELEARERRQRAERTLSWRDEPDGSVTLSARLDPVTAAPVRAAIEGIVTSAMRRKRDAGPSGTDQRAVWQMRADALAEIARHFAGCSSSGTGVRTSVVVRTTLAELQSGLGMASVDGMGQPVSIQALRTLAADAEIIPVVMGSRSEVLDVGRASRLFSAPQRIALLERDGGCAWCLAPPSHCEAHHIRWWRNGGRSDLENGVMLCSSCHHRIHDEGWEIAATATTVAFIPPRHVDPQRRPRPGGRARVELPTETPR